MDLRDTCRSLWMTRSALRVQAELKKWRRRIRWLATESRLGYCPLCEHAARFVDTSDNHRESPICLGCGSVPRQRALVRWLRARFPSLRDVRIHESSPSLCTHQLFSGQSSRYQASYYWPGLANRVVGDFQNVDLGAQPFADSGLDLVVTLDVLEHVPDPVVALREIERTLRSGGLHVFTVPRVAHCETRRRARLTANGFEHLQRPEYHCDPISRQGTLVVTDWGNDLEARIAADTSSTCVAEWVCDPSMGIHTPIEIFTMQKP